MSGHHPVLECLIGDTATWRPYIEQLLAAASAAGTSVRLNWDLPWDVAGICHYDHDPGGPLIELNVSNAKTVLLVLAHEVAHHMLSRGLPDYHLLSPHWRESMADIYAHALLLKLGAPITMSQLQTAIGHAAICDCPGMEKADESATSAQSTGAVRPGD